MASTAAAAKEPTANHRRVPVADTSKSRARPRMALDSHERVGGRSRKWSWSSRRRRTSTTRVEVESEISTNPVEGLSFRTEPIGNNSLKFKRKCQSIDQLRNFYQSQSTWLLLVNSILLMMLLIVATPVNGAAIAAVTNDAMLMNRSSSSVPLASSSSLSSGPGAIPSPVIRLPSNSLIKYTAYRDVSILHFQVPRDTRTLHYSFRAHEEFKSAFRKYSKLMFLVEVLKGRRILFILFCNLKLHSSACAWYF